MVTPTLALIVAGVLILLFALILPMLDSIKCFSDTISTRWSIVVIFLALGVGCVIDFETLSDNNRHLVLLGCLLMSILYVVFISLEKWLAKGWIGHAGITLQKGDTKVRLGVGDVGADKPSDIKDGKSKDGLSIVAVHKQSKPCDNAVPSDTEIAVTESVSED